MINTLANGYNIIPTTPTPDAPITPPENKPRTFGLFSCGLQWGAISFLALCFAGKYQTVFPWAVAALLLSLSIAALGLVWGVFQHVLKTIVRIVRHGA